MSHPRTSRPTRRRLLPALVSTGLATALVVGLNPAPVHAAAIVERTVPLDLTTASDVVADRSRVFVSGQWPVVDNGRTRLEPRIVVTDVFGEEPATVQGLRHRVADLELSPDGRTLFAALPDANEIAAIDTRTLTVTASYETGLGACPRSLAAIGAILWFGYGCDQWGGSIGRVDLAATPPAVTTGLSPVNVHGYPVLDTAADRPDLLFAAHPSVSPAKVTVLAVAADLTLTKTGETEHTLLGSNLRDVAAAPHGGAFWTASGSPYAIVQVETAKLSVARRRIQTGPYPNAVELSRDGAQVAAANVSGVFVFPWDGTTATALPLTGPGEVVDRGLAWAPNGSVLYAVTYDWTGANPAALHVYTSTITRRLA